MTSKKRNARKKVTGILGKLRPYIKSHGGDVKVLSFRDGKLKLSIKGACASCSLSVITYNYVLERMLKKAVPEIKEIVYE